MSSITMPRDLREFAEVFRTAGKACYIVGGALRDGLLGRPVHDYDAATDARPEEVLGLFKRVIPTGIKHGTVTVLWKGRSIEVTTFRTEGGYSDARRPDAVAFGASLEEDLERRDFTINAMAFDPLGGRLVDLHGGQADLKARLIRAVGDPARRFDEDGLRALRAVRFASQLGFEVEARTLAAIGPALPRLSGVSAERLREEVERILLSPRPSVGLRLMEETGILGLVLPELAACRGVEQKGLHRFDVLDHLFLAADAAAALSGAEEGGLGAPEEAGARAAALALRLAALLHDLGKPRAKALGPDGVPTFHRHEEYSAQMAEDLLRRLRFSNEATALVVHLVRQHMFNYDDSWSDAAVRRFLARAGVGHVEALFRLRLADGWAMTGTPVDPRSLEGFRTRIEAVLAAQDALGLKDLAIGGRDLAAIGVAPGPVMGRILGELLETVLDDPEQNTRETLLGIAGKIKMKYGVTE